MLIEVTSRDGALVLRVQGDVDLASAADLRRHLKDNLDGRRGQVVADLSDVGYMDSSGIAVLIEGVRWALRSKGRLVLAAPTPQVRMVMELAKLDDFFAIEPDVERAIARLNG
jgi:anti-anti-sigma factor